MEQAAITGILVDNAGSSLYERLDWSFGDKQKKGFTFKGTTRKYPVMLGEFGTTDGDSKEKACIASIFRCLLFAVFTSVSIILVDMVLVNCEH